MISVNVRSYVLQYEVFTIVEAFQEMETDHYSKPSFESPHNNVHNSVGCSDGTMYDLNWSAFDPIFMLHHANMDRLIALWQAIYYNSSIFEIVDYEGPLYGTAAGNVSADTPLKPFYAVDGNFHTSNSVCNVSTLGYTYPELSPSRQDGPVTPDKLSAYVKFMVNTLYTDVDNSTAYGASKLGRFRSPRGLGKRLEDGVTSKTWSIALQVNKGRIPLPATINCYLSEKTIGKVALLAIPAVGVTHSTIPLDRALATTGLDPVDKDAVIQHLRHELRFEVLKVRVSSIFFTCPAKSLLGDLDSLQWSPRTKYPTDRTKTSTFVSA